MEMTKNQRLMVEALLLAVAGSVMCEVLNWEAAASGLYTLTFPLTVMLWISSVRVRLSFGDIWMLLTLALAAVAVMVSGMNAGNFGISLCKKAVMLTITLLFFQSVSHLQPDRAVARFAWGVSTGLAVFFAAAYLLLRHALPEEKYLTFRLTNPNLAGLFLAVVYLFHLHWIAAAQKRRHKALSALLCLIMGCFLVLTGARSAMIAVAATTLLWAGAMFGKKRSFGIWGSAVLAGAPGWFAAAYLLMVNRPWVQQALGFLTDEGKDLDSRQKIWETVVESIARRPLLGDYFGLSQIAGISHAHNTHLEIAGFYGVPVLIGVTGLLWGYLYRSGRPCPSRAAFSAQSCFAGALILGIGEAALLCGGLGIYVFAGTFLLLSRQQAHGDAAHED